ncbi:MAG: hypothetical protein KGJ23_14010 [Euryarchaeota archaeon]|nr:hypothetical protein [Euryarchaeota archaeon]MDE1837713.1 hypothetical protein [Euryarchaeota archaeon]MDE2046695.1 hypothetical protein [Thermoplasmata archaeon]
MRCFGVGLGLAALLLTLLLLLPLGAFAHLQGEGVGRSTLVLPSSPGKSHSVLAATMAASSLPYRARLSMADDPHDGYTLVFGGQDANANPTGLTLAYHGGTWTNLSASLLSSPPARWGAAMGYDPTDQEVVLFGGCQNPTCNPGLSDTWTFSGGSWTDVTSSVGTPPAARGMPSMAWDPTGGSLILFGGVSTTTSGASTSTRFWNDTWSFAHNHWTNLTTSVSRSSPTPKAESSLSTVPSGGLVLFGGEGAPFADTWTYANGSWLNVTTTAGPGPGVRLGSMMAPDPSKGYAVLLGGYLAGTYYDDFWAFSSGHWTKLSFGSTSPPGTFAGAMAWDSGDGELLLYAGLISGGITNAVWTLQGSSWTLANPYVNPLAGFLLLFVVIFGLILILPFTAGHFARVKREKKLKDLFPPPSSQEVVWVPTTGRWSLYRQGVVSSVVLLAIFIPFSLVMLVPLSTPGSGSADTAFLSIVVVEVLFLVLLPIFMLVTQVRFVTRSIGVCSSGVIVQRKAGEIRVPWGYITPPEFPARRGMVAFRYYYAEGAMRGAFAVDAAQARAILANSAAAGWTLNEPVRRSLGLPPPSPPAVPAPGGGYAAPLSPPLAPPATASAVAYGQPRMSPLPPRSAPPPAAAPRAPLAPGYPPVPAYAPPTAYAVAYAPRPPAPTPLPSSGVRRPQVKRCPYCQSLQSFSSTYCSRCGQPIG